MARNAFINGKMAAAHAAYAFSDVAVSYAGNAGPWKELDEKEKNLYNQQVKIIDMPGRASAGSAVYGALKSGAFASAFVEPHDLLRMLPKLYRIAGENLAGVFHVGVQAPCDESLCNFGDVEDVLASIDSGVAMLASATAQEAMDMAILAHLGAIYGNVPFVHMYAACKESNADLMEYADMAKLLDLENISYVRKKTFHADAALQGRNAQKNLYRKIPDLVQRYMNDLKAATGRSYNLFDYAGAADAETVIVAMGSDAAFAEEIINKLNAGGAKLGLINVRLLRPFAGDKLAAALPASCKRVSVLDGTTELSYREPLFSSVYEALKDSGVAIAGGRYGIGAKPIVNGNKKNLLLSPVANDPRILDVIRSVFEFPNDRVLIANSLFADNIAFGIGMNLALTQRRDWLAAEVLFLAENTVYPAIAEASFAWVKAQDHPAESRVTGDKVVDSIAFSTVCSTCMNIVSMHDFLTKADIWVFGGALCDAKKDLGALLSTTENINILLIGSECEDKIEVPTGAHMEKICVKDHDEEKVLEAFAKAEAHSGPSVLIIAKAKE